METKYGELRYQGENPNAGSTPIDKKSKIFSSLFVLAAVVAALFHYSGNAAPTSAAPAPADVSPAP